MKYQSNERCYDDNEVKPVRQKQKTEMSGLETVNAVENNFAYIATSFVCEPPSPPTDNICAMMVVWQ